MITGAGGEGTNGNRLVRRASVFSLEMRGKSAVSSPHILSWFLDSLGCLSTRVVERGGLLFPSLPATYPLNSAGGEGLLLEGASQPH